MLTGHAIPMTAVNAACVVPVNDDKSKIGCLVEVVPTVRLSADGVYPVDAVTKFMVFCGIKSHECVGEPMWMG